MFEILLLIVFIQSNVHGDSDYNRLKWEALLQSKDTNKPAKVLSKLSHQQDLKERCRFELAQDQIPFTCYTLTNRQISILDKRCSMFKKTLRKEDFNKIWRVSTSCQRDLMEVKKQLLYIQSAESPQESYFYEVIDK